MAPVKNEEFELSPGELKIWKGKKRQELCFSLDGLLWGKKWKKANESDRNKPEGWLRELKCERGG
jgi:hypothetical protein